MSYIEQSLSAGEKIEGLFKLHWTAWIPVWLWVLLAIPTLGITLLVALYAYLRLRYQEEGVMGRMLGFGTVKVTGRGLSDILFKCIDDPMGVKRMIESVSNPID
jgi:hypothetical protein